MSDVQPLKPVFSFASSEEETTPPVSSEHVAPRRVQSDPVQTGETPMTWEVPNVQQTVPPAPAVPATPAVASVPSVPPAPVADAAAVPQPVQVSEQPVVTTPVPVDVQSDQVDESVSATSAAGTTEAADAASAYVRVVDDEPQKSAEETPSAAPVVAGLTEEEHADLAKVLEISEALSGKVEALEQSFSKRLQYDDTKETIIDRQHAELVELRDGLKKDLLRPLLYDLAEALDDIRKTKESLVGSEYGEQVASALDGVSDSLLYILEKNDVEQVVSEDGDSFVAARQRMVKSEETTDASKRKIVARSIAPGYVLGKETIFKEKVVVYKVVKAPEPVQEAATDANQTAPVDAPAPLAGESA